MQTRCDVPPDRCTITEGCDRPFEVSIIGWAGGGGWLFDACWPCARDYPQTGWPLGCGAPSQQGSM